MAPRILIAIATIALLALSVEVCLMNTHQRMIPFSKKEKTKPFLLQVMGFSVKSIYLASTSVICYFHFTSLHWDLLNKQRKRRTIEILCCLIYSVVLNKSSFSLCLNVCGVFFQAFAPRPALFGVRATTSLDACRVNAKKEKIKRNRENMRKFKTGGKKTLTRRKMMKKVESGKARQSENEFIAKCFLTIAPPAVKEEEEERRGRY